MARKRTLAEELAELSTTAPTKEHDPEAGLLIDEPILEASDEELDARPARRKVKEKGLRLRRDIDLDAQEYAGKRVSRAAAFEDDLGTGPASDSDMESGEGHESDDEDGEAGGEEVEEPGSVEVELHPTERPDEEEPGADDALHGFPYANGALQGGADEEAQALEREFEAARGAADGGAAVAAAERAGKERAKGRAAAAQRALWERALELRILLQRCVQAANRLPRPDMHAVARRVSPEINSGFVGLSDGACATLDALLELQDALLDRIPACSAGGEGGGNAGGPGKRKRGSAAADAAEDEALPGAKWRRVDASYARFAPYRDASMDRWHRKTMLMTGGGGLRGGSGLRALNQSLSAQVAALAKNAGPAIQRTQLPAQLAAPLMAGNATKQPAAEEGGATANGGVLGVDEEDGAAAADERDPETFDDGEFYQQLLKMFLEGSAGTAAAAASSAALGQGKKRRKAVERRASKGRKLRYQVMEKLVHFMAPVPRPQPPALAAQLFSNLFGRGRAAAGTNS